MALLLEGFRQDVKQKVIGRDIVEAKKEFARDKLSEILEDIISLNQGEAIPGNISKLLELTFTIFSAKFVAEVETEKEKIDPASIANLESVLEIFELAPESSDCSKLPNAPENSISQTLYGSLEKILIALSKKIQGHITRLNPLVKKAQKQSKFFWLEDAGINEEFLALEKLMSLAIRITNLTQNIRHNLMLLLVLKNCAFLEHLKVSDVPSKL